MPEIPYLRDVYQKYGIRDDFAMIGVSLDEDINELEAFLKENDMNWPQILDNDRESKWHGELGHSYAVGNGIPKSFLIDTDGVIIAKDLRKEDLLLEIGALFEH
jgi:peroxiredoxin